MNTAFYVVFALFVVAMIGLAVVAIRWGVRRDRAELAARTGRTEPAPTGSSSSPPAWADHRSPDGGAPGT